MNLQSSKTETKLRLYALDCVSTFVTYLAKDYAPFVEQTATALLPVFNLSIDEEIRKTAFILGASFAELRRGSP